MKGSCPLGEDSKEQLGGLEMRSGILTRCFCLLSLVSEFQQHKPKKGALEKSVRD